jgi:hypothetical protein
MLESRECSGNVVHPFRHTLIKSGYGKANAGGPLKADVAINPGSSASASAIASDPSQIPG